MTDESRRDQWEHRTEWPLTVLAVVFLAAYALPILRPDLSPDVHQACELVTWIAWAAFAIDYGVRLGLSRRRWAFVRSNLLDLALVVLPLLRPLRLLRLITLLSVLNRQVGGSLRGRVAVYVAAQRRWCSSSPRSRSSTPSARALSRTSRVSVTPCGGR